jgi:hypothetical protein
MSFILEILNSTSKEIFNFRLFLEHRFLQLTIFSSQIADLTIESLELNLFFLQLKLQLSDTFILLN